MNTGVRSAMQMLFRKGRNPGDTDLQQHHRFDCLGKVRRKQVPVGKDGKDLQILKSIV